MSWNLFLMKKLLKSEVCGTHKQYTTILFNVEKSKHVAGKKKRKKKKRKETQTWIRKHGSKRILNQQLKKKTSIHLYSQNPF